MVTNVFLFIVAIILIVNLAGIVSMNKKIDQQQETIRNILGGFMEFKISMCEQNGKFIDILQKILDSDEQFGKGMRETTKSLLDTVSERDKKMLNAINTIAKNNESIKNYVSEFVDSEDARITQIIDYIREVETKNDTD